VTAPNSWTRPRRLASGHRLPVELAAVYQQPGSSRTGSGRERTSASPGIGSSCQVPGRRDCEGARLPGPRTGALGWPRAPGRGDLASLRWRPL